MLPYIRKFYFSEKKYYWGQCDEPNTFCRIAVVLHRKGGEKVGDEISTRFSEPYDGKHAEIVALEYIVDELESRKLMIEDDSAVLDVIIRINNSPCSNCQEMIPDLLKKIRSFAPKSHFRLILFFSNLYDKSEEGIEEFSEWILKLVLKEGVIVFLCPLFVSKMVPTPYRISKAVKSDIDEGDQDCIDNFRDLFSKFIGKCNIQKSHDFFQESYPVYKSLFSRGWEKPHHIAILPLSAAEELSKVIIDPEFFKSKATKKEVKDRETRKRSCNQPQNSETVPVSARSSKRAKYSIN